MKRMIELEDVLHNLKLMTNVCNNHWGSYLCNAIPLENLIF
jgi:hypothetical protein